MKRAIPLTRERRSRLGATDRTSRHPIRSTMIVPRLRILAAIAAALAALALVLAASGKSAVAASSLVNGNFETGDLTGWTVDTTASGGTASASTSAWFCSAAECWYPLYYTAQEGTYFAQLTPGKLSEDTKISQPFEASAGDRISGWAFVQADDYNGSSYCDSTGEVVIKSDSGETVATPFSQCAYGVYYTWYGAPSGWKYWEHTFTEEDTGTGKFQIEARDRSITDNPAPSAMGLDDVKTSTLGPDTTKPSTSATRSVEPNAAGWNKEDVTVKLNATDNEGGWGVKKITYSASGAQTIGNTDASGSSADVNLNGEGTTTLTYYATDKAGNVEAPKTLTAKIDKTAPTVKSTSPADRATNVPLSSKISATFSESGSGIDPSTINSDTFKVEKVTSTGNVPVSGKVSYDEASKTVTFTPSSPLVKRETYQGYIHGYGAPPNVEDKADNPFRGGGDYSWRFSTSGTLCRGC